MIVDFSDKSLYNAKFIPLFSCEKRYVFLMGGAGSGKSKAQAQNEIMHSYERGNRLLGIRKFGVTIKDSMFAELQQVIEDWGLEKDFAVTTSPMRIINLLSGSDMIFRGMDDPEKVKSVKGVTRVWYEEATEGDKKGFDQLDIRLRGIGKKLQIVCTYNPVSDQHWLITDFWVFGSTEDVECIHSTYRDNRFVDQEQYGAMFARILEKDPNLYNIYAKGIPGQAVEGLIYTYESIPAVPEEAKFISRGLDFGFIHPACLVGLYEWNGGIVIDEEFHKSGMINKDILARMIEDGIDRKAEIVADNSRPEAIEEISQGGFNCIPCTKWPDSVINGIMYIKGLKLYITARSAGVKKDFDNYVWAKDKNGNALEKETAVKAFDDGPDAVRYGLGNYFDFKKNTDKLTLVGWAKKQEAEKEKKAQEKRNRPRNMPIPWGPN